MTAKGAVIEAVQSAILATAWILVQ